MSKLQNLMAKPVEIDLDGLKLELHPLTIKDAVLFEDMNEPAKRVKAMEKIIVLTLNRAIPDATEEEILNLPLRFSAALMEKIVEVNGFETKARA